MIAPDLRSQTAALLSELIQIDTTNPPGRETVAAEFLAAHIKRETGLDSVLVGSEPDRKNLVARIPGRGSGPSLLLLGHTDVVVADPSEWSVPPFSGLDRDGYIWGRGALDMKGQVAAEVIAFEALAREGWQGNGDLVLCAVADEEVSIGIGASWIVEAHPELVRTDYVLNEGGGERLVHNGQVIFNVDVGEKRCSGFEIAVHGRSGHASTAFPEDNSILKLVPVIQRIEGMARPGRDTPELRAFLEAIGEAGSNPGELARDAGPELAALLGPMLGAVINPTGLEGSARTSLNVIPGRAALRCDCRILPGQEPAEIQAAVASALEGIEYEFTWLENMGGTASPADTPLFGVIEGFMPQLEEGARLVPTISSGFTDSHYFREAFGNIAYGFMPKRTDPSETWPLIHSADERVAKDDLELGAEFFVYAARAVGALS